MKTGRNMRYMANSANSPPDNHSFPTSPRSFPNKKGNCQTLIFSTSSSFQGFMGREGALLGGVFLVKGDTWKKAQPVLL